MGKRYEGRGEGRFISGFSLNETFFSLNSYSDFLFLSVLQYNLIDYYFIVYLILCR